MLSSADLDQMRADLNRSLPDTAVVKRGTFASDGGGGGSVAYSPAGTYDCRIQPMQAPQNPEVVEGERLIVDTQWIVTLPAGTDVRTDDRLDIGARTYSVEALRSPRSYEVSTRAEVREVE